MAIFTLKSSVLKELNSNRRVISGILYSFSSEFTDKTIAVDDQNILLSEYAEIAEKCEHVAGWLDLISKFHDPLYVKIPIKKELIENDESIYFVICTGTKNERVIIVDSHQEWQHHEYASEGIILFEELPIKILDKNEAVKELQETKTTINNIQNETIMGDKIKSKKSIVATGSSTASDSSVNDSVQVNTNMNFHRRSFGIGLFAGVVLEILLEYLLKMAGIL